MLWFVITEQPVSVEHYYLQMYLFAIPFFHMHYPQVPTQFLSQTNYKNVFCLWGTIKNVWSSEHILQVRFGQHRKKRKKVSLLAIRFFLQIIQISNRWVAVWGEAPSFFYETTTFSSASAFRSLDGLFTWTTSYRCPQN